jgi:hypothetical protein
VSGSVDRIQVTLSEGAEVKPAGPAELAGQKGTAAAKVGGQAPARLAGRGAVVAAFCSRAADHPSSRADRAVDGLPHPVAHLLARILGEPGTCHAVRGCGARNGDRHGKRRLAQRVDLR